MFIVHFSFFNFLGGEGPSPLKGVHGPGPYKWSMDPVQNGRSMDPGYMFCPHSTERPEAGQQSIDELFKKLELFEGILENQQKILQEHNIMIKEMKVAVAKVDRGIQVDIGKLLSVYL